MSPFLAVKDLSKSFGGVHAVAGMDFAVDAGTICGIIGPNGSGKTTLLGLLSGTYRPDQGTIHLGDRRLDRLPAHRTVRAGVARTFQTTRLFARWTLNANLAVGLASEAPARGGAIDALLKDGPERLAALVGLPGRGAMICSALSNAEQRLAMIAVAVATRPLLLLLDEPAVGMSPNEALGLAQAIRRIRDELGITVLIVEHNMHFMMGLADRILAMAAGRKLAEGTPTEVRRNRQVIDAYLGA